MDEAQTADCSDSYQAHLDQCVQSLRDTTRDVIIESEHVIDRIEDPDT